ncbi:MAG: hypothetical protein H0U57_05260 [Tatlockia sp.]|nr:hypothetical protein [Tatlockia sp.]
MTYITYNKALKTFCSEKARPNNQSSSETLKRLADRLINYISTNKEVCLTTLQANFIAEVPKNKPFLSTHRIDVAHHVAISEIINLIVEFMNNPSEIKFKDWVNFSDAMCSTESSEDDKGRYTLSSFFYDVKNNNDGPKGLCTKADNIIRILNCCTRNLIPGNSSVNRSIGQRKDPHYVGIKGKPGHYEETSSSKNISKFFAKLPNCSDYEPITKQRSKGPSFFLSSSIESKVEDSYVTEIKVSQSANRRFKN